MSARSRSPAGKSDWISRIVVGFARYQPKRPPGLHVDASGAFRLSNLMAAWGDKQGLSAQAVLDSIERNMWANSGAKRFEVTRGPGSDCTIRAADRQGAGWSQKPSGVASPQQQWTDKQGTTWDNRDKSWDKKDKSWNQEGKSWDQDSKKDDQSWDKTDGWEKKDATRWKAQASSSWESKSPWQKQAKSTGSSWQQNDTSGPDAEKVQRWLGWALKTGHAELGIYTQPGGWADLAELAQAMAENRPEFGVADAASLRELLRRTDEQGRFEIDARGRLRKVARDERQQHGNGGGAGHASKKVAAPVTSAAAGSAETRQGSAQAPPIPPGEHWMEYVDNDVFWWYYEGPLGKWWMSETDEVPMPWTEA